ncbi:MAG: metal ABC transporter permease [Syntrophomonadaceae bacterium]|nr:metal ABC transporter permease [Syntrophomonadaceae bacterium]MDD3890385.1 metal ABC transporter permease [Syntrophomonadaceae bacterium]MDD4550366.1 metal ABC transporter permease [Syntrophomonadaceae bacterium]
MINAILQYQFLQNAALSAALASIACGIIGTIIIEKKMVMMSGGIAHTAFGGIGLGYFLGIEPITGALGFSVLAACIIAKIQRTTKISSDVLIGMFWSLGMALGILFIAFTPGYPPDMNSYLFGDILTVSQLDLKIIITLNCIIVFVILAFFNLFKAYLFDEEFATVIGIPTIILEYTLYILIALTVVVLIRVVGIILIIALLTAPPSIARQFTNNLKKVMSISVILGIVFSLTGLWLSYTFQVPSGATIIIVSVMSYLAVSVFQKIRRLPI